ncbi:YchJ family protein [Sulfurovum mangrovi]|uniref:YchJ family protein n=1 Tax=Sulfurovum mangrovi TaxID=2893889 RepID=UPI001E61C6F1|nr:YchJ family metal-binding protein [Sulfurovum mangrovi]UFH59683.1 SEC-C domain-containing protein [Sulfurovum mangrovi]UFH60829.1 SEC-C domain-containing protein [Sulfurovum mangrovi]
MAKVSPNIPCPCGSQKKYKKCCAVYHKGALAPDALSLMKSRYSAYAAGNADYIIKTTHPDNPDYTTDRTSWKKEIDLFSKHTEFLGLKILEFIDGEEEAYVTFEALLSSGMLHEKSRFLKSGGVWLYVDGVIS